MKIEGKVLWIEQGASKHNPHDKCYFLAVAIEPDNVERDMLGDRTYYVKPVLQGDHAKACLKLAKQYGINETVHMRYEPVVPMRLSFQTDDIEPNISKKEHKYKDVTRWDLQHVEDTRV